jgi:hypothetical protein
LIASLRSMAVPSVMRIGVGFVDTPTLTRKRLPGHRQFSLNYRAKLGMSQG